jgi:hypothetical protein
MTRSAMVGRPLGDGIDQQRGLAGAGAADQQRVALGFQQVPRFLLPSRKFKLRYEQTGRTGLVVHSPPEISVSGVSDFSATPTFVGQIPKFFGKILPLQVIHNFI